jgi:hypothetical protein
MDVAAMGGRMHVLIDGVMNLAMVSSTEDVMILVITP